MVSCLLRRLIYQLYQPPKIAAARTRMPIPAPIPALAPVERPPPPPPPFSWAATVGVEPGVLVNVTGATTVVTGVEAMTTEVTVEKTGTPFSVL